MSDSQKLSYISLICKDSKNSHLMKNYRPISLLNTDRKMLSKIITNRLTDVLPSIIGISQTCSVKGRSIFDNKLMKGKDLLDLVLIMFIYLGIFLIM